MQRAGHGEGPSHYSQHIKGLREDVMKLKTEIRKQKREPGQFGKHNLLVKIKRTPLVEKKRLRRDMLTAFNCVKGCQKQGEQNDCFRILWGGNKHNVLNLSFWGDLGSR